MKLKKKQAKTNNFGSVSGSFEIPTGLKTGQFTIQLKEDSNNEPQYYITKSVSVEEYKRPKFKIEFKPIIESFAVNDSVVIEGFAESFSGARLSNAGVNYRILRFEDYGYDFRFPRMNPEEIANRELKTDENGDFTIEFIAKPETSPIQQKHQVFSYRIEVSVTDINGETQSGETTVHAANHLNILRFSGPADHYKENGIKFTPKVTNLNNEKVDLPVTVDIYKLQAPDRILNFVNNMPSPDTLAISKDEYHQLLPHTAFLDEDDTSHWKNAKLWYQDTKSSNQEIELKNLKKWPAGIYRIVLKTKDKKGNEIAQESIINLQDKKAKVASDHQLFQYHIINKDFTEDGFVKVSLLTAAKELFINLEAFIEDKSIFQEYVHLKKGVETIKIPAENYEGKVLTLRFSSIKYNSSFTTTKRLTLETKKPKPEIILSTFRDKIEPGNQEKWTLKITSKNKQDQFEVLAGMYDASLDQFRKHSWSENINIGGRYYQLPNVDLLEFSPVNFSLHNRDYFYFSYVQPKLPKLDYFGFSYSQPYQAKREYLMQLLFKGKDFKTAYTSKGGLIKGKVLSNADRNPLPGN